MSNVKKRNNAMDFWKLFCTFCTACMHFNARGIAGTGHLIQFLGDPAAASPPFFRGGLVIEYFLLAGGFLMAKGFASRKKKGLIDYEHPSRTAFEYLGGRFKTLWPAYFMGSLIGYIIICAVNGYAPADWFNALVVNIWEFTGLRDALFSGFTPMVGINPHLIEAFSYPMWYISAILITAAPLYYLMIVNEERFKALWCPFFATAFTFAYTACNFAGNRAQLLLGMPVNCLWIVGGHCLGALIYYFVEFLQKKQLSNGAKTALGIANMLCSLWIIVAAYTNYYQWHMEAAIPGWYTDLIFVPFFCVTLVCNMLNQDFFTKVIDQPIFGKLGEYSLYFFVVHWPCTRLEAYLGTEVLHLGSYWAHWGLFFLLSIVLGAVAMFIGKKFLQPWMAKVVAPAPKAEQA